MQEAFAFLLACMRPDRIHELASFRKFCRTLTWVRFKRILPNVLQWDDDKSQRNLLERGFGFDHAAAIFLGPTLEAQDNRRDYGEVRVQAIGRAGDDILSVVYSDRGEARRIISARLTNKMERKLWQSFIEIGR